MIFPPAFFDLAYNKGIFGGDMVCKEFRAVRAANSLRIDKSLTATGVPIRQVPSLRKFILIRLNYSDKGVENWVEPLNLTVAGRSKVGSGNSLVLHKVSLFV